MADTDTLIREWEASPSMARKVAAGIARKIAKKKMHRYEDLPPNSALSAEWDLSERTVSAAKSILGDHGILIMENGRYYVALSQQPRHQETEEATPHERNIATSSAARP